MVAESKAFKSIREIDAYGAPNSIDGPLNADVISPDVHGPLPQESTAIEDDLKEL